MGGSIDISEICGVDMKKAISILGGNQMSRSSSQGANEIANVLLRNRQAEGLAGNAIGAQHTAIALGKSSASLYVPFAAAGSPAPSNSDLMTSLTARSTPGSAMRDEIMLMSPGLTPIGAQRASLLLPGGSAMPLTADSRLQFTPHNNFDVSDAKHEEIDMYSLSNGALGDVGRNRLRVSFGPPSRLSFSGYGAEEPGEMDLDEIPPSKYPRRSLPSRPSLTSSDPRTGGKGTDQEAQGGVLAGIGVVRGRAADTATGKASAARTGMSPPSSKAKARAGSSRSPPPTRSVADEGHKADNRAGRTTPAKSGAAPSGSNVSPSASKKPHAPVSPRRAGASVLSRSSSPPPPPPAHMQRQAGRTEGQLPKGTKHGRAAVNGSSDYENMDPDSLTPAGGKVGAAEKPLVNGADAVEQVAGKEKVKALVAVFAIAQQLLSQNQCKEAIEVLHMLPTNHFCSGLVYQMIGKGYLEMADYRACLLALRAMLKIEPYRIQGTETMSTALWHLKSEKELCALGQQV
jgi:hypothetical protein